jgi:hypothetical protein
MVKKPFPKMVNDLLHRQEAAEVRTTFGRIVAGTGRHTCKAWHIL